MVHRDVFSRGGDFQRLDSLKRNRQKRSKTGLVFVEGVQPINSALENGVRFESVVVDGERRLSPWAERVIRDARADVVVLHERLMSELSDREDPSELVAIVRKPAHQPGAIASHQGLLVVVIDRPGNEGNLGSVIRSADAFRADAVITTGHGVDMYDPRTIRASVGAIFNTPVMHCERAILFSTLERLHRDLPALRIVGSSARGGSPIHEIGGMGRPCVLMLGSENAGLSKAMVDMCTEMVSIPMRGYASSLNIVGAASIFLYQIDRG